MYLNHKAYDKVNNICKMQWVVLNSLLTYEVPFVKV